MLRNVLVLHFTLCLSYAFGQEATTKRFQMGASLGLTTSQVSGDNLSGFHKFAPMVGGFVYTNLKENLIAQFGINYVQKGSRKIPRSDQGNIFYTLRLNYIEVPMLLKFKHKKLMYEFGPSIGALVSFTEETHAGPVIATRDFRNSELSFNVGASFPLKGNFHFLWRFNNSILHIREHVNGNTFRLNLGQYNTALHFILQYHFTAKS